MWTRCARPLNAGVRWPRMEVPLYRAILALTLLLPGFHGAFFAQAAHPSPKTGSHLSGTTSYSLQDVRTEDNTAYVSIEASYPIMVSSDKQLANGFNEVVSSVVRELSGDPKDWKDNAEAASESSVGSNVSIGCLVGLKSQNIVSLGFSVNQYVAGAAHPNHFSKFLIFSIEKRKEIQLRDLFKKGSEYLKALSNYCINELRKDPSIRECSDDTMLLNGAGPAGENYSHVLLTEQGINVTFDEYQVASYACGSFEVLVPYEVLERLIDPKGPLKQYAKR